MIKETKEMHHKFLEAKILKKVQRTIPSFLEANHLKAQSFQNQRPVNDPISNLKSK